MRHTRREGLILKDGFRNEGNHGQEEGGSQGVEPGEGTVPATRGSGWHGQNEGEAGVDLRKTIFMDLRNGWQQHP